MKFSEIVSLSPPQAATDERLEFFNLVAQRNVGITLGALNVVLPGGSMSEPNLKSNRFALAPGRHGGKILTRQDTELYGLGPGAIVTMPVTAEQDAILEGITFSLSSEDRSPTGVTADAASPLVLIKEGAKVVIRNCVFRQSGNSTAAHVQVDDGGSAVLVGCVFKGTATSATPVVDHPAGAATDVQVAFCYNRTGNTLGDPARITMTGNI